MACEEKDCKIQMRVWKSRMKKKERNPREIDITLFDHTTVSNFWVKLLLYVM